MSGGSVLFDLDDTLYPEKTFVQGGFNAVSSFLENRTGVERSTLTQRQNRILESSGRGRVFDTLLDELCLSAELVPVLVHIYRTHLPSLELYPAALRILRHLRSYGVPSGIVTDGMGAIQRRKIASLEVDMLVDAVVCSDELGPDSWKPSSTPFMVALELLGERAEESVYIGNDPSKDFGGANRLGMKTVQVLLNDAPLQQSTPEDWLLPGHHLFLEDLDSFLRQSGHLRKKAQ